MDANSVNSTLKLAKQGDPRAISSMMNHKLKPKGITVKTSLREDCLRLLFEANSVPDKAQLIPWVENSFRALNLAAISQVQLYGKSFASEFPDWQHVIQLKANEYEFYSSDIDIAADRNHKQVSFQNSDNSDRSANKLSAKGTILDFSVQRNQGVISGDNGKRYTFSGNEWNLSNPPEKGTRVDFEIEGNQARSIYEDLSVSTKRKSNKSRVSAGLLALFLGGFGVHYFYLGAWGWGLIFLIFFWTYIPAIAAVVAGIRYLIMSDEEFDKRASKITKPFDSI